MQGWIQRYQPISYLHPQHEGPEEPPTKLFCGGGLLDLETRRITIRGRPISLSRLECRALAALFQGQGQVVTPEVLFAAVWPGTRFSASNLRALIGRLRQKLEPSCIETIGREGYAWAGRSATPSGRPRY